MGLASPGDRTLGGSSVVGPSVTHTRSPGGIGMWATAQGTAALGEGRQPRSGIQESSS